MPPPLTQKGLGKKGRDRQSRSRNTTPSLVVQPSPTDGERTAFLDLPLESFRTAEGLLEIYGSTIPSSQDLEALHESIDKLDDVVETRCEVADKGMRKLSDVRKRNVADTESKRVEEESKERAKRDAADEGERGRQKASKIKIKKRKDTSAAREERPMSHGLHGLARQDGEDLDHMRNKKPPRKMSKDNDSASSSLSPVAPTPNAGTMDLDEKEDRNEDESSSDERQPVPAAPIQHQQMFGDDPSTFPDSTIYEIRPVTEDMNVEQKKEIYSVAHFPPSTLEDLIPGSPPDKDFSNAKPSNQVQANTFATYLEPYFRPLTEEDLAFLRDKGVRGNTAIIPRRGKKTYQEIWQEEDGALSVDQRDRSQTLPANHARGSIEDLTDEVGETDQVSAGPVLSRLLSTMRPEHRAPTEEKAATNGTTNGESSVNGEANNEFAELSAILNDSPAPVPPATFMAESNSEAWKKATHPKLDHGQVDERVKQELRHIGFLPEEKEPDYEAHFDDEVAQRIRYLQSLLDEKIIMNNARKDRIMDMAQDQMARQEFDTITEDLDSQVQTAYLKRTRTLGKTKKTKRPGGAGGGSHFVAGGGNTGMARPGIGDTTKALMEKRSKWIGTIGVVFDNDENKVRRSKDPGSSIFKPEDMVEYVKKARENYFEEAEEE